MYIQDEWPEGPNGTSYDGLGLWKLLQNGESPFRQQWDVALLVKEVEEATAAKVRDIPLVSCGANYYGFHFELENHPPVLARLARGDVNMPDFDGFPLEKQIPEVQFEAAVYSLARDSPVLPVPHLIRHRMPVRSDGPHLNPPIDISGRRLMLFEKESDSRVNWRQLNEPQQDAIITQAAGLRAALYNLELTGGFDQEWFLARLFEQKPSSLPIPVAPTREFCLTLLTAKINATIRNIGDMIGWESDNATVGPIAAAAKQSLLRLIPHILPADDGRGSLYRLVLEHGDFGIHNMTISIDPITSEALITSLYDWETGCITPALLSDLEMAVIVDLNVDANASPTVSRMKADSTKEELETYAKWARSYTTTLFNQVRDYKSAILAGKDARHLWFALRDWRGQDPEGYFGSLGDWAEKRLKEMGKE
ncbi:hypothetical protein NLG97_g6378 [Lecanicillium saksenae]|uniref:Uncharacterized protein n=1 Tax=Lecanicillium saksenae TaxID=468837 RepID=A0ACC1QSD0_9HYPO|nr:hypothetical protein NLG97_g6378 [Lecanicillium saksenae]